MQLIWFLVLLVVFLHLPDLYNLLLLHLDTAEHTLLGNHDYFPPKISGTTKFCPIRHDSFQTLLHNRTSQIASFLIISDKYVICNSLYIKKDQQIKVGKRWSGTEKWTKVLILH